MRLLAAAALAFAICGCSTQSVEVPSASSSSSVVPVTASAASASPTPLATQPSASPPQTPSPTPMAITDISQVFRPLSNGWRPSGPTILVATADARGNLNLVGVPFGPSGASSPPVSIVSFASSAWDVRPDGGALAVAVATDRGVRIATFNFGAGAASWATPPDPAAPVSMPVWSKDGVWLYYGTGGSTPSNNFAGTVHRIHPDGTGHNEIATLERFGGLQGLTPDGRLLIWSRLQEGGSAELLDVSTGTSRHIDDVTGIASIRARPPRYLLTVGGCCAGFPGGSLALWDDVTLASRTIAARTNVPHIGWGAAAWDPGGTRIVAARFDDASPYRASLGYLDADTGAFQPIAGTLGAGRVLWLDEGIVFLTFSQNGDQSELMLLPSSSTAAISLYKGANMYQMVVVRP
ncbi:MAG TPA: hypothetical protein VEU77_01140 [Candidatus Acidoferrales bacterium]|nr:hypothetical protein [Candidatus Acidoferrales bacterium]